LKVCIIGLGLIGASLGKALKYYSNDYHIIGIVRKRSSISAALKMKAADEVYTNLQRSSEANIVVIASPVDFTAAIYKELSSIVGKDTIITDTGSVKYSIEKQIRHYVEFNKNKSLPVFVGAHPMSGKETNGLINSDKDLFKNANVVITGSIKKSLKSENVIANMWKTAGSKIIKMPSKKHDELVSLTSHLPHLIAFALNKTYKDKKKKNPAIENIVAGSFYSAIRVASSSADMWAPIFEANREHTIKNLNSFVRELCVFQKNLSNKNKVRQLILKTQK
jgi:prephenate dehydrogenase